jgi:ribosomal protein L12E/L44/L45/RPP1/RPP2
LIDSSRSSDRRAPAGPPAEEADAKAPAAAAAEEEEEEEEEADEATDAESMLGRSTHFL